MTEAADSRHHQRQKRAAARGDGKRPSGEQRQLRPVGRQQIIPVGRIQRCVGVRRQRIRIQLNQPAKRLFLLHGERKNNRRSYGQRGSKTDCQSTAIFVFLLLRKKNPDEPYQQNGAEQKGLRLHQYCGHVNRQRKLPLPLHGENAAQQQKEGQYAVRLPPRRAVDQRGRIQRIKSRQKQRWKSPKALFSIEIQKRRARQIKQNRPQLHQQKARLADRCAESAESVHQAAGDPAKQHISRRIVAEIVRSIKACRAHRGHSLAPRRKAADIDGISCDPQSQKDAQPCGQQSDHDQREGRKALFAVLEPRFQQQTKQQKCRRQHAEQHRAFLWRGRRFRLCSGGRSDRIPERR